MSSEGLGMTEARAVRRLALLQVIFIASDVILREAGIAELCKECGEKDTHQLLLGMGALAWGSLWALWTRLRADVLHVCLWVLGGTHLGLLAAQLAIPRFCLTCTSLTVVACIALALSWNRGASPRWTPALGLLAWFITPSLIIRLV